MDIQEFLIKLGKDKIWVATYFSLALIMFFLGFLIRDDESLTRLVARNIIALLPMAGFFTIFLSVAIPFRLFLQTYFTAFSIFYGTIFLCLSIISGGNAALSGYWAFDAMKPFLYFSIPLGSVMLLTKYTLRLPWVKKYLKN